MMSIPKKKRYLRHAYGTVSTNEVPIEESNDYLRKLDSNVFSKKIA